MRTGNSIKNSLTIVISNILSFSLAFVSQAIFIRVLGAEYLGLNGLFTNILTMLSIFELGIGNAIVYKLYKPIADNNVEDIKSLMRFYKKAYRIIAISIMVFGLMLLPFLKMIVGEITVQINLYVIYFLFLLSTITSYFMTYKRNLIIANQRSYIINIIHMVYFIILNVIQLLIIYYTHNYYIYLCAKILCQIIENILINIRANRDYPYVKDKVVQKINPKDEKDIFQRVKALFFHKVGSVIISGTDNIIISSFLGVIQVGFYSNYYYVINACNTLFGQIISSTTASVGNLLLDNDNKKSFDIFKKIRFFNFWIAVFTAVSIFICVQPFISIWVGSEYLFQDYIVFILVFNYYQKMMRGSYSTFKDSAGIWVEDKWVPIIEAAINIVISVMLVKCIGIAGVFIGTIISGLTLWLYSYPIFVYKKLFNRTYYEFIRETLGYMVVFILILLITKVISSQFMVENMWIQLLISVIISLIIPNVIMFILYRKTDNYKYFVALMKKVLVKFKNRTD